MNDLPRCGECKHPSAEHGDRAITPCMGGWQGPAAPFTVPRCHCPGYRPDQSWYRKLRKAAA